MQDPETGELLAAGENVPGSFFGLPATSGAVEILQGYPFGTDNDGDIIVKERTFVRANPGSTRVDLTIDPS